MRILGLSRRMFRLGRCLARDEGGAVLIYVSIALTVFMGFAALVIDGGRLFTLDTELQSHADALALAGAAELDGSTGARTRADAAMNNLVQNSQTFASGAQAITGYTRRFLDELPADDALLISNDFVAADDAAARFVEVTVTTRNINTTFARAIGGAQTAGTSAVAVAGFTSAVCKFTPLFMCNPYEGTGLDFLTEVAKPAEKRRLIQLKKGPSSGPSQYFPGNFGFLQPADGRGANAVKESLGKVDPGACFRRDGVELRTGNINSVRQALNTRFDMYEGPFNKNNSDYRPAQDVTKGYMLKTGNSCSGEPDPNSPPVSMGMPLDDCSTGGCGTLGPDGTHMWGNGNWDFEGYWDMNHGDRDGVFETADGAPNSWSNTSPPSRYDVYRHEVGPGEVPNKSTAGGEDGRPQCYNGSAAPSDEPDRRMIYAAVLNCDDLNITGGSSDTVPALAFVKMFLTQPMTKTPGSADEDGSIFVEIVDVVKPGIDDEVIHDIVQLYR